MPIYYRGPELVITHEVIVLRGARSRVIPIRELRDLHIVRIGGTGPNVAPAPAAGGVLAVVVATWPMLRASTLWAFTCLVLGFAAVVAAVRRRRAGEAYELRGSVGGRGLTIFRSRDRQTFGQVVRALVRALESTEDFR